MRISLVVIISMLMPASARVRNMREAKPGALWMPVPTMLTLPTCGVGDDAAGADLRGDLFDDRMARSRSGLLTVNVRSVSPSADAFWTMTSTER